MQNLSSSLFLRSIRVGDASSILSRREELEVFEIVAVVERKPDLELDGSVIVTANVHDASVLMVSKPSDLGLVERQGLELCLLKLASPSCREVDLCICEREQ